MKRRVIATLLRGTGPGREREVVWARRFAYMDTAMPRILQLAIREGEAGDIVEFGSDEFGFQLGVLHLRQGGKYDFVMSELVKHSPTLLKLM